MEVHQQGAGSAARDARGARDLHVSLDLPTAPCLGVGLGARFQPPLPSYRSAGNVNANDERRT